MTTQADLVFAGGAIYTADATARRMIAAAGPGRPPGQRGRGHRRPDHGGRPAATSAT